MNPIADPAAAQDAAPELTPLPEPGAEQAPLIDYWGRGQQLIEQCIENASQNTARQMRDRADIFNLKLDRGGKENHWTVWDSGTNRYVERGYDPAQGGLPPYVPRPVTNMFRATTNGVTAILDQSEPAQTYGPETEADSDRATAEVCADAVPVLLEECGYHSQGHRATLNRLCTLTDKVAYVPYYDTDEKYGMEDVEMFSCTQCGAVSMPDEIENGGGCPECGNTDTEGGMELAIDDSDPMMPKPLVQPMPVGKLCAEVIPCFEFSLPSSARNANVKAAPWVLLHSRMAPEDVKRMWPKSRAVADDKTKWGTGSQARQFADHMRQLSSPTGTAGVHSAAKEFDGPVVYRLQHDPIDDKENGWYFPDGFYGVMIGGVLVAAEKLPFTDGKDKPIKNIVIRTYADTSGNQFGHPPADDYAPLQVTRNMVEALIILIIMHDSAPTKYLPESVTLIDQPTGQPGEWVRYRSLDGQKPTETRGINPPEALFNYLDRLDAKFEKLSGLNSVLSGDRPAGDPTLGEVQILEERGQASFRAPLDSLITFEKDLTFLLLTIGRQTMWSPRFRRVRGEDKQWELTQFAAADLSGNVDIVVDRASAWPKSPLMQQLRLKEAVAMGVLMPAQDPEIAGQLLVEMNLAHLKKSWDVDRRQVARELDKWRAAATPEDIMSAAPDPSIINIDLHVYLKTQFLKGEDVEELRTQNPPVYQAMVMQVQQLKAVKAQQQMAAAVASGQVTPAPAGEPAAGSGGTLDAAIESGAVKPQQPTQPQALDAALQAGALVPQGAMPAPPQGPSIDDLVNARMLTPVMAEDAAAAGGPGA